MRIGLVLATALGVGLMLASAAFAGNGRIAVGLVPGAESKAVIAAVEEATGGTFDGKIKRLRTLLFDVPDVRRAVGQAKQMPGVEFAERAGVERRIAFTPNDPLLGTQWYLTSIRAFDYWAERPPLAPVRVAVIDSGIDASHPEFAGRIRRAKSFVRGSANVDEIGHGTMVAGEIAAAIDNEQGIAGVAFPAELLIAKVVKPNGTISLEAEARAIRWAADRGARVINMSLGGQRDPNNPARDTYSELEQRAIDYAIQKGALVVAATGNCPVVCPYQFASYPAALPHVLGVSALNQNDRTPAFSNRDAIHNDLAAPGADVVSLFPTAATDPICGLPGISLCADVEDYRRGEGTSFAAPLVSAAAALAFAERPDLEANQVADLLKRTAVDIQNPGRDTKTGAGRLDVTAALDALVGPIAAADNLEPNDDAGSRAHRLFIRRNSRTVSATLDFYEDATDVYRVRLRKGERGVFRLVGPEGTDVNLVLWRPGTKDVTAFAPRGFVAAIARKPGAKERIRFRAKKGGWYFLQVKLSEGVGGPYRLTIRRTSK